MSICEGKLLWMRVKEMINGRFRFLSNVNIVIFRYRIESIYEKNI